jgi:predicted lipoprotein with Yx(FWY)xxD motif
MDTGSRQATLPNGGSHMFASRRLAGLLVATIALVAACSSSGGAATTPPAATAPPSAAASTLTIGMATSSLGTILVGPNGLTLYTHAGDTATTSACSGACATSWPPLTVASGQQAALASGITGTLATLTRSDGSVQVTFNGLPLYYWQGDKTAGDTTGQGLSGFTVATMGGAPAASPSVVSGGY